MVFVLAEHFFGSKMSISLNSISMIRAVGRALFVGLLLLGLGSVSPAKAQNSEELAALLDQIRQIKANLDDLNLVVLGGKKPLPRTEIAVSTNGGSTAAAHAEERFAALEEQIQGLTGALERFGFEIGQARTRLDKLIVDIDFRLTAIEQKMATAAAGGGATQQGQPVDSVSGDSATVATAAAPQATGDQLVNPAGSQIVVSPNAPGTKVLGTIPAGDVGAGTASVVTPPPEPEKPKGVLPEGTVQVRYDFAFKLVRQFRTAQAEVAFKEFLAAHGDDPLADNARYWLGESYYARRDYAQAAATFVDAYSKAPQGPKARDNLLKLGMSLSRLDQKESACESFDEMLSQFSSPADGKARKKAELEKKRAGCS